MSVQHFLTINMQLGFTLNPQALQTVVSARKCPLHFLQDKHSLQHETCKQLIPDKLDVMFCSAKLCFLDHAAFMTYFRPHYTMHTGALTSIITC